MVGVEADLIQVLLAARLEVRAAARDLLADLTLGDQVLLGKAMLEVQ